MPNNSPRERAKGVGKRVTELREYLEHFNTNLLHEEPNQYKLQPNNLKFNDLNVDTFNTLLDLLEESNLNTIIRTPSGAIAKGKAKYNNSYAYDLIVNRTGLRLTILFGDMAWVFKLGRLEEFKKAGVYPNVAFATFKKKCLAKGIDLDAYKINNGLEVKKTIPSPLIKMKYHMTRRDLGISDVHHIDFHNSYPAGLCNTHPEFRPVIEPIYEERKIPEFKEINKAILVDSIGWMQSYKPKENRFAEWAHLSKDAITDNNKRVIELAIRIQATGHEIIGYNTDGIWYKGDVYHGQGEGPRLGEWQNDHINCIFRSRSDGAYEFIENGRYEAVVRGLTTYDLIEPEREKWKWGDIFNGEVIQYKFDKSIGKLGRIIKYEV